MRVLLLIISSPGTAYNAFKKTWLKYVNSHPDIDGYFIEFGDIQEPYVFDGSTIYFRGRETMPGCLDKTLRALKLFDFDDYDYLARSNLSSVVHLANLYEYLTNSPRQEFYSGYIYKHYGGFCSGSLFILSSDIVKLLIEQGDVHPRLVDDVYIGKFVQNYYGDIAKHLPRVSVTSDTLSISDDGIHYRFKENNNTGGAGRSNDIRRHYMCAKQLYPQLF